MKMAKFPAEKFEPKREEKKEAKMNPFERAKVEKKEAKTASKPKKKC